MVPEKLMADFVKLSINNLGSIIPVPEGVRVELHSRPMFAGGEDLSWGGDDVMLVVSGALFVTSPVERVGYREIRIDGPMYVPKGSEGPIRAKLRDLRGPSFSYRYPQGARLIISEETFGQAFLEMLPEPTPLLVFGELTIDNDVTLELLRSKVPEIVVIGQVSVPKSLVPVVQLLAPQKFGEIRAAALDKQVYGVEMLTKEYLEMASEPVRIQVYGVLTIDVGVTPELFDEKVMEIDTYGVSKAPKALIPLIQLKGDTYGKVEPY